MKIMEMTEKQNAIDACSCPRTPGEILVAPLCAVELVTGEREGLLFVTMPAQLVCPEARRFSYGEFCLDQNRLCLYRKYGV